MSVFVILKTASEGWRTIHRMAINKQWSKSYSSPEGKDRCFTSVQNEMLKRLGGLSEHCGVCECVHENPHTHVCARTTRAHVL